MQTTSELLPSGKQYTPGICIFCNKPFNEESSGRYSFCHEICGDEQERKDDEEMRALLTRLPDGTQFEPC